MNIIYTQVNRLKLFSITSIFFVAFGLLIALLPVMAFEAPKTNKVFELESGNCYAQLASAPGTTFTSTSAAAIQTAINAAPSGDIVKIAGTCRGVSYTNGLTQTAYIDKNITLQGGFTVTNWITPDLSTLTILDADKLGRVINLHFGSVVTITNLQISNGDASVLNNGNTAGGGIRILGASAYLDNVKITHNKSDYGAGIFNNSTDVTITNCQITDNYGLENDSNYGGGIFNYGHILISNTLIEKNIFTNTVGNAWGAGIVNNGTINLINSIVKDNVAQFSGNGGAINNNGSAHMTISQTQIINNESAIGGGIINYAYMTITASTLSQNSGGAISNGGNMLIEQSTINNNSSIVGAGIDNTGQLTITNSTLSGNNAAYGAALRTGGVSSSFHSYNNSIINNHSSNHWGSSIYAEYNAIVNLSNTLIGENTPFDCSYENDGTIVSEGYNIDSDGTCIQSGQNSDITANDIGTKPLDEYGGNTLTHALKPTSPAIDNGICTSNNSVDQRGVSRPEGSTCDIGAFEFQDLVPISGLIITNNSPTVLHNTSLFSATIEAGDSAIYRWDFGDGTSGRGAYVSHVYATMGDFTPILTVFNPINTITRTMSVKIEGTDNNFLPIIKKP